MSTRRSLAIPLKRKRRFYLLDELQGLNKRLEQGKTKLPLTGQNKRLWEDAQQLWSIWWNCGRVSHQEAFAMGQEEQLFSRYVGFAHIADKYKGKDEFMTILNSVSRQV